MGVYPVMYALLDVERTIQGLPELEAIEFYDPSQSAGGYFYWSDELRRGPVRELARTFQHDHQWLLEEVPEGLEKSSRAIVFTLGSSHEEDKDATVTIAARYQTALPESMRVRFVLAEISFGGAKNDHSLPLEHPASEAALSFLKATQPIYALVMGDSIVPSVEDANFFQDLWRHVYDSTFLGPELLPRIPKNLLSREAGLAHLEQLGAGLWITVTGGSRWYNQTVIDSLTLERHQQACNILEAFLETLPNLLPDERE